MDLASDQKGFAGIFIRKALAGEAIRLFGSGQQRRDFNHVDDVVHALLLAAECKDVEGEVYNLGHPEPASLLEFVEILHRFAEFDHELVPFPPDLAKIDIGDYFGDFGRFHAATGWTPETDLERGLESTLSFYRERARPSSR
jgi:UDP-glucose 4-epimerase